MANCAECTHYDEIDETTGKCKRDRAERHIAPKDGHDHVIVNGWPIVNGSEAQCGDHS